MHSFFVPTPTDKEKGFVGNVYMNGPFSASVHITSNDLYYVEFKTPGVRRIGGTHASEDEANTIAKQWVEGQTTTPIDAAIKPKAKMTRRQLGQLYELLDKYQDNLYRRGYHTLSSKTADVREYVADDITQYDDANNTVANRRQILQS